jgi:hypothetical protein
MAIGALIGAIYFLHCIGFIDVRGLCGCMEESKHFDSLRVNPYAHELDSGIGIPVNEPEMAKL